MPRADLIRPLPETLRAHAGRLGSKTAYADDRRTVSYAELERRTRRLGGHLAALGLARGDRAVILLNNRVEVVESYCAVNRAAGVGVPINPRSTDAELAYLLDDSGARIVITDDGHAEQVARVLDGRDGTLIVVNDDGDPPPGTHSFAELAATDPAAPPPDDLGLDEIAWMLYTSGTTGAPKGVHATHRNCLWSVAACYAPILGLSEEDHVLWPLPLFHSLAHVLGIVGVTAVGASARIVGEFAPAEVLGLIHSERPTFLVGVPTMYRYLLRAAETGHWSAPSLRACLVTGAVAAAGLRAEFEAALGVPLLDSYGSTETSGAITVNAPHGELVEGSCGRAVPGLELRLVDPQTLRDVPAGAEGEVWVSAPNVMSGYHNAPEATAAALVDGWYRTGDLARRDERGFLTITGRIRELIVRGGENIHPAEIEAVLLGIDGVADAAVAARPHEVLGEVPVAYLVPSAGGGPDPERVFARCRELLATFKVPEELLEIAAVPRTGSGKVMRHALRDQPARLRGARDGALFTPAWVPAPTADPALAGPVLDCPADPTAVREAIAARLATTPEDERLFAVVGSSDPARSAVIDAVRAAQAEHPGRIVLVETAGGDAGPALSTVDEPHVAVRDGVAFVPRLQRAVPGNSVDPVGSAWDPTGTVLVTGATGVVGRAVARHLVHVHGVRSLVLLSRSGPAAPGALALAAELAAAGARVRLSACDVTDAAALADACSRLPGRWPLRGVLHAAGPAGALHVHEATAGADLTAFVLSSDATGVLGLGFGSTAPDAVATWRHSLGLPAVSIAWGPWDAPGTGDALRRFVPPLPVEQALGLFDAAVAAGGPVAVAARLDPARIAGPVPTVLRGLGRASDRHAAGAGAALAARLADVGADTQYTILLDLVRAEIAAVLGTAPGALEPGRALRDLGFDSVATVELRNGLNAATGLRLPATLAYDHPNPRALAVELRRRITGVRSAVAMAARPVAADEPIAIVGMACRYPGGVTGPDDLWDLVAAGRDGVGPFPADRGWDPAAVFDPGLVHTYRPEGGFLADAAGFDAAFFGISPREALTMDPQQRLLLEVAWEAVERAGIDPAALRDSPTGVFAGLMYHDYNLRLAGTPGNVAGFVDPGTAGSVLSGRVAYVLGLTGPAVTVDTACSSSLVALHLAVQALRNGECGLALTGGVTVMATPGAFTGFSRQGGLAADGRCKSFAGSADGTGWAEGVGVLVVERLSDARRN
ncbi:beta-ketoacyl synthase N-terminal-like domain-containing protein, partial [Dactylosporangium sucinum]